MKALDYIIIESDQQYNNEALLKNGTSLVINTKTESVSNINRVGKVVSVPSGLTIKEGDLLLFHHNILRKVNDHRGEVMQSNFIIKDNLFFVPLDMVFMYKRGDDDWKALTPFCFIKPIKEKVPETKSKLIIPEYMSVGFKGRRENRGIVKYGNSVLTDWGVKEGDEIIFKDYREYEFDIDGEILYKMASKDVLAKICNV
jgi:co-chaperonin GroES (HSP10)